MAAFKPKQGQLTTKCMACKKGGWCPTFHIVNQADRQLKVKCLECGAPYPIPTLQEKQAVQTHPKRIRFVQGQSRQPVGQAVGAGQDSGSSRCPTWMLAASPSSQATRKPLQGGQGGGQKATPPPWSPEKKQLQEQKKDIEELKKKLAASLSNKNDNENDEAGTGPKPALPGGEPAEAVQSGQQELNRLRQTLATHKAKERTAEVELYQKLVEQAEQKLQEAKDRREAAKPLSQQQLEARQQLERAKTKQAEQKEACRKANEAVTAAKKAAEEAAKQQEEDDQQAQKAQEKCDQLAKQDTAPGKEPAFVDEGEDSFVKGRWVEFSKLCSKTFDPNTKAYQELETDFKEQYQRAKARQEPQQQEAMAVDGAAAKKKADDDLAKAEAKRQRQAEAAAANAA